MSSPSTSASTQSLSLAENDGDGNDGDGEQMEMDTDVVNRSNNLNLTDNSNESETHFDRRLPITHPYLGDRHLGELSAELLFEEPGAVIKVPVMVLHEVCLLPGQKSPLRFSNPESIQFLSDTNRQRSYFAMLTKDDEFEFQNVEDFSKVPCHPIGTLFQIQNAFLNQLNQMNIEVIGRQRCRLIEPLRRCDIHNEDAMSIICDKISVQVLEEKLLNSELIRVPESSINRLCKADKSKWLASLSPHSLFVLRGLSTEGLIQKLVKWLSYWFKRRQIDLVIQQGSTLFSYWVAENIPVSLEDKLELLEEDSTDRRLAKEWWIVSQLNTLICLMCEQPMCAVTDIINLSVESNSTHFINPGGFIHDLFTVNQIQNIEIQGEPSDESSWFTGYQWTVIICSHCSQHIGWRFTSSNLIPRQFYGISRRSFRLVPVKPT